MQAWRTPWSSHARFNDDAAVCDIFVQPFSYVIMTTLPCGQHTYCVDCIIRHVLARLDQNTLEVRCPGYECRQGEPWRFRFLENIAKINPRVRPQLDRVSAALATAQARSDLPIIVRRPIAPMLSFSTIWNNHSAANRCIGKFFCESYDRCYCTTCSLPWLDCAARHFKRESEDRTRKFLRNSSNYNNCPWCKIPIEKTDGCRHMRCRSCRKQFCWDCLVRREHYICTC